MNHSTILHEEKVISHSILPLFKKGAARRDLKIKEHYDNEEKKKKKKHSEYNSQIYTCVHIYEFIS